MENNELMHWGVKGMKWGVRRYQNPDGSLTPKGVKRYGHDDYRKAHSKKKVKHMSDRELADRNKRLEAENKYKNFQKNSRAGKKAVNAFIAAGGTALAVSLAVKNFEKFGTDVVNPYLKPTADKFLDKIGDMLIKNIKF